MPLPGSRRRDLPPSHATATAERPDGCASPRQYAQPVEVSVAHVNPPRMYEETLQKGVHGIVEEFRLLRRFLPPQLSVTAFTSAGEGKNRYKDVLCIDETRVHLHNEPPPGAETSDYIHANWVDGSKMARQFICTQGPTEAAAADFWRMIYQTRTPLILMLCEPVEKNKNKCMIYWPTEKGQTLTYGAYTVRNTGVRHEKVGEKSHCRMVSIKLTASYDREPWQVYHAHWLRECRLVGALERTDKNKLDVAECVKQIRAQRLHSVQNEQQYVFIYRVVLDFITLAYGMDVKNPMLQDFWTAHATLMKGCAM